MKYKEGFGKFFSGIIGFLLWLFPIVGAIVGGYLKRNLLASSYSYYDYSSHGPNGKDVFNWFVTIIGGIAIGLLLDVILLGPMVVFINIQNYLEDIRNKLDSYIPI